MRPDLAIGFACGAVGVRCGVPGFVDRFSALVRHCRCAADAPNLSSRFHVERGAGGWRIGRGGAGPPAADGLDEFGAVERLLYEVTLDLGTRSRSRLVLHAAGLSDGEQGLILAAPSGSGKSTLAAWLAVLGLDFLSDELLAISLDGQVMTGFPRALGLKDTAHLGADARWPRGATELPDGPVWIDPERLRAGCVRQAARPLAIVVPHHTRDATPVLRPMTPAMAAFRLLPCLVNRAGFPKEGLTELTALTGRLAAYELIYREAADASAQLRALLKAPLVNPTEPRSGAPVGRPPGKMASCSPRF